METILHPKESTANLWGKQKVKEQVTYRLMKYLLRTEVEEGLLLHNVVTRHLVLLTPQEAKMLSSLPSGFTETMRELIEDHFLVPEEFDEYRSVNQLRKIYRSRSVGNAINHYVILPTTFCNAHCFYCYESDYPRVHMTEETAKKLIDYITDHRQNEPVSINWFGGEPLVGIERIDQISQGLKERNIPFSSSMISNGYLFDETIVERAVDLWKLNRIQITLDGTEEVYNRTKAYVNAEGSPFLRVLRNIDLLSTRNVHVAIRLNMDFYNKDDIRDLMEQLGERYSGNDFVRVYVNSLFNNQGYVPVQHSQDEKVELFDIVNDYTRRLKELSFGAERREVPSLIFSQCMADDPHTIEIQPDGSFCRCEHESILDSYGNLDEGILDPQKPVIWKETIERSEHCPDCPIYPSCYLLRHCMNADEPCVESIRLRAQKQYMEKLRATYHKSLEGTKNEEVCDS